MSDNSHQPSRIDGGSRHRRRRSASAQFPGLEKAASTGLFVLFAAILLWAPMPLGSNRPWFLALLATFAGVALIAWSALAISGTVQVSNRSRALWPAALGLSIALCFAAFQIVDLKQVDLIIGTQLARDVGHPIWQLASDALDKPLPSYVAVNPGNVFPAVLKTLLFATIFFLSFELGRNARVARNLLTLIAVTGGLHAALGVAQGMGEFDIGGWLAAEPQQSSISRFSSTFVNPNHFATFAGIALMAALGLTYDLLAKGIVFGRGSSIAVRTLANTLLGDALPAIAAAIFLIGTVFLSESRGAAFATLAGCTVLVICLSAFSTGKKSSGGTQIQLYMLAGIILIGIAVAVQPVLMRVEIAGLEDTLRAQMTRTAIDAAVAAPLTGNGFGGFADYYPLYASVSLNELIDEAHNDYAETLGDLGFVGAAAFLFAPAYLMWLCFMGCIRRRNGKVFPAIGLAAATFCAVQAFFDFSLQIPAVGVLLYATLGVAVAQSWNDKSEADAA